MKNLFHKITSFSMALIVLFSTFSFTVEQHYCGDFLVDYSLFGRAESCGMDVQEASEAQESNLVKQNCCDDETLSFAGQDNLKVSFEKLSFEQHQFIVSFVYSYINLFEGFENNVSSYEEYRPPLVIKQLYKIDETYLI